jgi:hypothetical protein
VFLTRAQGLAIKALLDAKKNVTATVKMPSPAENAKVGGGQPPMNRIWPRQWQDVQLA